MMTLFKAQASMSLTLELGLNQGPGPVRWVCCQVRVLSRWGCARCDLIRLCDQSVVLEIVRTVIVIRAIADVL